MTDFTDEENTKISHHIKSISKDMYEIKKMIKVQKEEKEDLLKKEKKRRESLKKAQKNFYNVSTNLKKNIYEKLEKRLDSLKISKSKYIKNLILEDLKIDQEEKDKNKNNGD